MKTQVTQPPQPNRLMRTDIYPPKNSELERTSYNRPSSNKKLDSLKSISTKVSVIKKEYNVEENMTESKIYEAKQGLQLLKKKMSAKGMSREKGGSHQNIGIERNIPSLKTVSSQKVEETNYDNRNSNMPPKNLKKQISENEGYGKKEITSSSSINANKNVNQTKTTPQNERKKPSVYQEQYQNEEMEIPIKPKKDFNAMLEEELRKENQRQGGAQLSSNSHGRGSKGSNNEPSEFPDENMELVQCRHCERNFGEAAIDKHEKICLKVFQQKRKAFDSAAQRGPEEMEQNQFQSKGNIKKAPQKAKPPAKKEEAVGGMPKWKAESLQFRASLKQASGQALTKEEKAATEQAQDVGMVVCNYCGRKFATKTAERHIPFCETKSKQMPRMNVKKK